MTYTLISCEILSSWAESPSAIFEEDSYFVHQIHLKNNSQFI